MDLKKILKALRLQESNLSMILGAIVIIAIGLFVVNYFRNLDTGTTIPGTGVEKEEIDLPTEHQVAEGETLWVISEKYYKSGYNWVDIVEANDLTNPNQIETGQKLTIPDVEPRLLEVEPTPEATQTAIASPTPSPTIVPSPTPTPKPEDKVEAAEENKMEKIEGEAYTVVKGDNLWNIAVRAYGDGYKWVEIAKTNKLVNPNLIHAGNKLILPR